MKIICLLANGFEETEAIAVLDILIRANYNVKTISTTGNIEVIGAHNIKIIADSLLENIDVNYADVLFLPGGGPGTKNLSENQKVIDIIKNFNENNKYICAICAAPTILEKANIINGKKITSYPSVKDQFKNSIYLEDNVVVDGNIITSRGLGTAIDMGLKMVEIFSSKEESDKLKTAIVYKI